MSISTLSELNAAYAKKVSCSAYFGNTPVNVYIYNFNKFKAIQFDGVEPVIMPSPASFSSGGTSYTNGSTGFMKHPGTANTYIAGISLNAGSQLAYIIHDRIWACSGILINTTATQTITNFPTSFRNPNNYIDIEYFIEVVTAYSGSNLNATIDYINTNNVSKQTIVTIPSNAPVGSLHKIIPGLSALEDMKDVIKQITAVKLNTTGTSGELGLTICRRLFDFGNTTYDIGGHQQSNGRPTKIDWMNLGLHKIDSAACLQFTCVPYVSLIITQAIQFDFLV